MRLPEGKENTNGIDCAGDEWTVSGGEWRNVGIFGARGKKTRVVMDMGSGTLGRLTALMPPEKLDALLLSHWHFDHCSDVLPLLFRLQACAAKPLDVYAPVDESSMVRKVVQQSGAFCLHDVQKDDEVQLGEFSVRVFCRASPCAGGYVPRDGRRKRRCATPATPIPWRG